MFAISSGLIFKEWVHQKLVTPGMLAVSLELRWITGGVCVLSNAVGRFEADFGFESDCKVRTILMATCVRIVKTR